MKIERYENIMNGMNGLLLYLTQLFSDYTALISFLTPAIGGEVGVITVSFLAAIVDAHIVTVICFTAIGMIAIDSVWFFVPRTKIYRQMVNWSTISEKYKKVEKGLETLSHNNDIIIILLSKILIGTRILIVVYVGLRNMRYRNFLSVIFLPNCIWAATLVVIGYVAKENYQAALETFNSVLLAVWALVLIALLLYVVFRVANSWATEKLEANETMDDGVNNGFG